MSMTEQGDLDLLPIEFVILEVTNLGSHSLNYSLEHTQLHLQLVFLRLMPSSKSLSHFLNYLPASISL